MSRAWLFLHLLGFTMWLGGAIASMVMGIAAKQEERSGLGAVVRAQSKLTKVAIAPGALLTVLSGIILTFQISGGEIAGFSHLAGDHAGCRRHRRADHAAYRLAHGNPAGAAGSYR